MMRDAERRNHARGRGRGHCKAEPTHPWRAQEGAAEAVSSASLCSLCRKWGSCPPTTLSAPPPQLSLSTAQGKRYV